MLTDKIKKKKLKYHGRTGCKNIEELIEQFEYSGVAEFTYKGIDWGLRYALAPCGEYKPGIVTCLKIQDWTFFETWEDLIENFNFPDGKNFLDLVLNGE